MKTQVLLFVAAFTHLLEKINGFYIHGSVHRESNLIIVQQDATYSVYYVSIGSSTCFGCFTHCSQSKPETVITVVRAPVDGCQHRKHVELPTEM